MVKVARPPPGRGLIRLIRYLVGNYTTPDPSPVNPQFQLVAHDFADSNCRAWWQKERRLESDCPTIVVAMVSQWLKLRYYIAHINPVAVLEGSKAF